MSRKPMLVDCPKCGFAGAYVMLDFSDMDAEEIPTFVVCPRCNHRTEPALSDGSPAASPSTGRSVPK